MAKKSIFLLGQPVYNEDGVAGEVITPGQLLQGVTTLLKHASAGANAARTFALERDEMGKTIDNTYAIGDTVKVGSFHQGEHVLAFIASGQNLTEGQLLESAGNGTLRALASGVALARSLETTGAVTVLTRVRVEIV